MIRFVALGTVCVAGVAALVGDGGLGASDAEQEAIVAPAPVVPPDREHHLPAAVPGGFEPGNRCVGVSTRRSALAEKRYASSRVVIAGCATRSVHDVTAEVRIDASRRGALSIDLVAPGGAEFPLKRTDTGDTAAGLDETYMVDMADVRRPPVNGAWTLRVTDASHDRRAALLFWALDIAGRHAGEP